RHYSIFCSYYCGNQHCWGSVFYGEFDLGSGRTLAACLIHASRAQEADRSLRVDVCGMSGGWVSNTWATCLMVRDNTGKLVLTPNKILLRLKKKGTTTLRAVAKRWARAPLASWWDKSSPRQRCVADLRGRSATLGLRHGPDSYGRQQ